MSPKDLSDKLAKAYEKMKYTHYNVVTDEYVINTKIGNHKISTQDYEDDKFSIEELIDKTINPYYYDANLTSEEQHDMARDTSKDLYYGSQIFEIDVETKTFEINHSDIYDVHGQFPWGLHSDEDLRRVIKLSGEKADLPRLKLISETTGKKGSMFLADVNDDYFIFKPSKGTLINPAVAPTLKGWQVKVKRK